ncbi:MAG: cytochrome c [Deltaproteobacteria bacterium]|nr:cytochrome c [Deltaproteobacteria bacterium]
MRNFKLGTIIMACLFTAGLLLAPSMTPSASAYDEVATKALYDDKCAKCHGLTGKGDGKKGKTLKKKPRDYTDKAKMAEFTDQELIDQTKEGKKPMPSYGSGKNQLSDEQITDLITYIRTFAK